MTTEQITLLASLFTLGGVMISIAWGTIQHHWTETERRAEAAKVEKERAVLAQEIEKRRTEAARSLEEHLEKRAIEIRTELEKAASVLVIQQREMVEQVEQARILTEAAVTKVEAVHELAATVVQKIDHNTVLTAEAVEAAHDAYKEANGINSKIATIAQTNLDATITGKVQVDQIAETGDETLERVKRVEATVVVNEDVENRLSRLEDA